MPAISVSTTRMLYPTALIISGGVVVLRKSQKIKCAKERR